MGVRRVDHFPFASNCLKTYIQEPGAKANPFVDPEEYQRFLVEEEGKSLKQLEEERAALR